MKKLILLPFIMMVFIHLCFPQINYNSWKQIINPSLLQTNTNIDLYSNLKSSEWINIGPEGSVVRCLDIVSDNPDIIYAGTDNNGVYKSVDGGLNWAKYGSPGDGNLFDISVDSKNSSLVYVGFFRGLSTKNNPDEGFMNLTFNSIGQVAIYNVAVNIENPAILYGAIINNTVYQSIDTGKTWNILSSGLPQDYFTIYDLTFYKSTSKLFLCTSKGLFSLENNKTNWDTVIYGIDCRVFDIDQNNENLYIGSDDSVFISLDSGMTWNKYKTGNERFNGPNCLKIDQNNPLTIYISYNKGGIYKTIDGGNNWFSINVGLPDSLLTVYDIEINPANSQVLYAGTEYEGVYKSTNGGNTWIVCNGGNDLKFWRENSDLIVDYTDNQILYISFYGSVLKSIDGGINWSVPSSTGNITYCLTQDLANNKVFYLGRIGEICKTTDGWDSYISIGDYSEMGNSAEIVIDYSNSDIVYALSSHGKGIFKSINAGNTWTLMNNGYKTPNAYGGGMIMDAISPLTLYSILLDSNNIYNIYKTENGGSSWDIIYDSIGSYYLTADPTNTNVLYTYGKNYRIPGWQDRIMKSSDGGTTWTDFYNKGVYCLAVNPFNSKKIVIGGINNFEYSRDGGNTWTKISNGLPSSYTLSKLVFDPTDSLIIYAITNSDGVYKIVMDEIAPASPSGLYSRPGDEKSTLYWTANTENDLKYYKIYRDTIIDSINAKSIFVVEKDSLSYTDINLTNHTTFYYWISAIDSSGNESILSNRTSVKPNAAPEWQIITNTFFINQEETFELKLDTCLTDKDDLIDNLSIQISSDNETNIDVSYDAITHLVIVTSNSSFYGQVTVTITATDADGLFSTKEIYLIVNNIPFNLHLVFPKDNDTIMPGESITFKWKKAIDFDDDNLKYDLALYSDQQNTTVEEISDTSYEFTDNNFLKENTKYQWTIFVSDGKIRIPCAEEFSFYINTSTNIADNNYTNVHLLVQNFPNPFKTNTVIKYKISNAAMVNISVYDINGNKISTLVNEFKSIGEYSVNFEPKNVISGYYIFKLNIDGQDVNERRMLFFK